MKTVIVVESPAKARKIKTFFKDDTIVTSSFGHIIDLPKKQISIDIQNNFKPTYETMPGKSKIVSSLKNFNKGYRILLAADDDREGDAIAWHCGKIMNVNFEEKNRIIFHEISKRAIENALENPTVDDLVFTTLLEGETVPSGATLLGSAVETKITTYKEIDYEYYILKINQGSGISSPVFSDKVRVNYSGSLEDGTTFDSSSNPVNFDLVYVVAGWNRVMPEFNAASSFDSNPDGTVDFLDYGMGAMFLPSGLGYYADFLPSIPSYSNLIFKFELLQAEVNDHDGDYVSSYFEDINGDFDLFNLGIYTILVKQGDNLLFKKEIEFTTCD